MPRLSVDIDLAYVPIESRADTLNGIESALKRLADDIRKTISTSAVTHKMNAGTGTIDKLFVKEERAQIKIEANHVIRGALFDPSLRRMTADAEETFELFAATHVLAPAELYGAKICDALDRQHPRDLFDMKLLFENESEQRLPVDIRQAFVVYLASHSRPMHELLTSNEKDISSEFETTFRGMSRIPVDLDQLYDARKELFRRIPSELTHPEREFLVSIKEGSPKWDLIPIPGLDNLPAILWKLQNIKKMDKEKHQTQLGRLRNALEL